MGGGGLQCSALTEAEEVGRQTLLVQVVVGAVQHLQLGTGSETTRQVVQLVHADRHSKTGILYIRSR